MLQGVVEPGSVDLALLHRRLLELKFDWRGHEQVKPLALAYDWLYPQWSATQREQLKYKLADGCDYLIDVIRKDRLSPYNVILYNSPFQALMACSIALYRDDPRGDPIMNFTADMWLNRVLPVWRQIMGKNGGWHEGGEYVGIGIGQAIYQLPAMWRNATGQDLFAAEPGIRGFLDFLVYRTRPDGTHFRWGDAAYFDRIVPDATPLALELRHAAAYSLRPPGKRGGSIGMAMGSVHRPDASRPDCRRAPPAHALFRRHRHDRRAQRLDARRDLRDVQGGRQLLVAYASRPGCVHHLQGRRTGHRQRPLRTEVRLRSPHELRVSGDRAQHDHGHGPGRHRACAGKG